MASPQSLLVVDDSEPDRELIALTLAAAFPTAQIHRIGDPGEAKKLCAVEVFDCVLLDYHMPEMDGLTLTAELRAAHPYLPVILVTAVGDEMLVAASLRAGASDYMPKSRMTAESIRRAVDRSISLTSQARTIDEQRSELENFAYALAHDFKQPIRQIMTFSQLITEGIRDVTSADTRQHLTFLGEAARRLGKLVDVMSQYTLLNQPPDLSDVSLERVMANVRVVLAPFLAERRGKLVTPRRNATVLGNETLLTQVLQNLVANGLHYNRSPTPEVAISLDRTRDHWVIQVRDNGIGIEPQYLSEIFKPLVRLHTSSEYTGSGLGLTLARKAVLAQKGAIWCDSTPGQGSTFYIQLPIAKAATKRKTSAENRAKAA